jgi:hypothetical protein
MRFITLDQAKEHCKAESCDDNVLAIYIDSAERECEKLANRRIFKNATERSDAIAAIPAAITAASTAYDAAIVAADALTDEKVKAFAKAIAEVEYDKVKFEQMDVMDGIVIEKNIINAMLLLIGHWYRNREETIIGQTAVEIPSGTQSIMYKYRKVSNL